VAPLDTYVLGLPSVLGLTLILVLGARLLGGLIPRSSLRSHLLARVELVTNAIVLHPRADNILEPIVVTLDFESSSDNGLHSVVVAHDLNLVDDAILSAASIG
jgi:hypothetical protein